MAPLSSTIIDQIREKVISKFECKSENIWDIAKLQIEKEQTETPPWLTPVVVTVVFGVLIISSVVGYVLHRYIKFTKILNKNEWDINIEDVIFYHTTTETNGRTRFVNWPSIRSLTDVSEVDDGYQMVNQILQWPAKWNGVAVGLRLLELKDMKQVKRDMKVLLLSFKNNLIHNNIPHFYGLSEINGDRYIVSEYCARGALCDVIKDPKTNLNKDFRFSLCLDIANGLCFLHSKAIIHGNLTSMCCLLDVKWSVKIADWEYQRIYTKLNNKKNPLLVQRKNPDTVGQNAASYLDFWTAPELLKDTFKQFPTMPSDVYSLGIIFQEIFTRQEPYFEHLDQLTYHEVLKAVIQNNLRPKHGDFTPTDVRHLMDLAWDVDTSKRPNMDHVVRSLRLSHRYVSEDRQA